MTFGTLVLIYLFGAILYCLSREESHREKADYRRERMSRRSSRYSHYYR